MARIRSDKPEAYQSETLAEISLAAERTFKGMATIADDRGRLADKPAQINGELWSMRGNHTTDDLEAELAEAVKVDLVCRYTGCNGKRYLHLVRWDSHQKIDRPSKSRLPRCPLHQVDPDYCGLHEGECKSPEISPGSPEHSRDTREPSRDLEQVQTGQSGVGSGNRQHAQGEPITGVVVSVQANGHPRSDLQEQQSSRDTREPSMLDLGSRILDLGSRTVDLPATPAASPDTAQTLIAEWLDHCRKRPPDRVIGQIAKELAALLAEDQEVADIRAGLARWHQAGKHPSTLASFVNEVMNAAPSNGTPGRPSTTDQRMADAQSVKAKLAARRQEQA